jgi:hypothetical protein
MKRILLVLPFVLAACDSGLTGPSKNLVATAASLSVTGQPPITAGPVAIVQEDIGTCNNFWAVDSFDKFYTLTLNHDGTYNLQVNYKNGTFSTLAGASPGACESAPAPDGNGKTVVAGITGKTHQEYNHTVSAIAPPNQNPNCGVNNVLCPSAKSFLDAVFGAANWSYTSDLSWTGHYEAGNNGVWFDTSVDWPNNDRGDITGD